VQSLSQLDAVYGRVRAQVLRDNMESQIYYRPSNFETASYLERALGRTSEYAHSQTERGGESVSQGLSEQGVPLLTAQEIAQLPDTDIIGFHRRLPPFRGRRMDWRRMPDLVEKRAIKPPSLPHLLPLNEESAGDQKAEAARLRYIDPDNLPAV
jgi:type IV secretory pathway TraG/TraD family ATPase VirD4